VFRRVLIVLTGALNYHHFRFLEDPMKKLYTVALAMLAGAVLGAAAVQGLHAQAKPPAYVIAMNEVMNEEGYAREFAPKAEAIVRSAGGRVLVRDKRITALDGRAPVRVVVQVWDSLEKIQAWHNSAEYKDIRKIGEQYTKFHIFAVEGLPQ
jgi:uncharacterized protein (DUF1330 family)